MINCPLPNILNRHIFATISTKRHTDKKRNQIVKVELLFVCDGLDVETECGTDNAGVFPIDLQDNGSLP